MTASRNLPFPPGLLAALVSSMVAGDTKMIEVEIDPNKPLEEQLEAAAEKARAAHREECPDCRAEYEAEQKAKAADAEPKAPSKATDIKTDLRERHMREREELALRHQAERDGQDKDDKRKTSASPVFEAPYGGSQVDPSMATSSKVDASVPHEIGFAVFYKDKLVENSFGTNRAVIEKKLAIFQRIMAPLNAMAADVGLDINHPEIRPVYVRRKS